MKSATTITTTHFGLFLVVLLLVILQLCACQSSWSRQDEQLKYGQRKLPTKGDDGGKTSQEEDILPDNEENLDSEEVKSSNFPTETSRTNIRKTMDNMAREMRSKTMSKIFQGNDMQEPIEQMVSYGETGGGGSSSSSSSSHHDNDEGNIQIAVKSKRRYEFVPFHYDRDEMKTPRMIEIVSDTMPLRLHFKSQSAAIVVTQSHMSPPMKPVDEKVSMDEPYHLKQEIHRPILQTVKEFIHPYRNIVQTLRPVREDIRTIVPKDSDIGHNHMIGGGGGGGSGSGGKTNDWSPVSGAKRSSASIRQPVRLSPSQQLQQNRYGSSARPITQLVEGVKASESRASRLQRRAHHSFLDKPSRLAGAHSYNKYNTGLDKSNMSPMQYGSSEPELIYLPMYAQNEHQLNHRHSLENDYADTESHISSYIDHLKNEEGTSDEPTVVPGSIGETLSRAKRHHPHHHNNNNMVQCNEMGCEVSGSDAHSSSSSSWADDAVDDDDYDRHYF